MTLKECIDYVDSVKQNAFTNEQKTMWINEVEGRVQTKVFLFKHDNITQYEYEANKDTELFVRPPYQELYYEYLQAKIDYQNGEYDKYQNSMTMYESVLREFAAWFINRYHPADIPCGGGSAC